MSRKEKKFFENIGSPEGGRETGDSGDNADKYANNNLGTLRR